MYRTGVLLACIILLAVPPPFQTAAQTGGGPEGLREGLVLFKQEQYQQAIAVFRNLISDPASSAYKPDAYFWIAKSYMTLEMLEDAEKNLEFFLINFPDHPYYPEAYYQKGRLLYLQKDYESSIQAAQDFIHRYPKSEFVASAYFWFGESLYSLGQLEEAARVFGKVIQDYPQSFKVEAARYRLSLIEFKKREDALLKLLKWSHEESLKAVEEFQRREKAYEQAIAAYQRKLSGIGQEGEKKRNEELTIESASLKARIRILEAQLASPSSQPPAEAESAAKLREIENLEKALQIKAAALALKESLLGLYEKDVEKDR